jgi:hypothetical protein
VVLLAQAVAAAVTEQTDRYSATTGDVLSDALLGAGLLLSLAGLEALRRSLAPRMGALAIAGQAAIVLAIAATIVAGHEALDAVYVVGTVAWLAGMVGIAVAGIRSGQRQWRVAIALPAAGVIALALADAGGAVLLGILWLVLGVSIRRM